jgi:hypothetical protein
MVRGDQQGGFIPHDTITLKVKSTHLEINVPDRYGQETNKGALYFKALLSQKVKPTHFGEINIPNTFGLKTNGGNSYLPLPHKKNPESRFIT